MVGSSSVGVKGYRPHRPVRAVLLTVVLGTTAGLVWLSALHQTAGGCRSAAPAAAAQSTSSQQLPAGGLDAVPPAPPQFTRVQVLNANGVRGEAAIVDEALAQLGFASTTTPANDPLYPAADLHCYGEIRFGAAGQAAARTLSLAVPCAELVRDVRPDSGVDLALGTRFLALRPNDPARTALLDLAGLRRSVPVGLFRGGLAALPGPAQSGPTLPGPSSTTQTVTSMTSGTQSAVPVVDAGLLRRARQVRC